MLTSGERGAGMGLQCRRAPAKCFPEIWGQRAVAGTFLVAAMGLTFAGCGGRGAMPRTSFTGSSSARPTAVSHQAGRLLSRPARLAGAVVSPPGIRNFHVVNADVLRGSAPTLTGLRALRAMGVKTDIDLRATESVTSREEARASRVGLRYINIPMSVGMPAPWKVQKFLNVVTNKTNQPVFIHCTFGEDRTGAMVGIYREVEDHWNFQRAYREMRADGFHPIFFELKRAAKRYSSATAVQAALNGRRAPTSVRA